VPVKALSLISGGIDSPVATHLILKRGLEMSAVHFDNRPFTDDKQLEKTKLLVSRLEELHGKTIPFYIVPFKETHIAFGKNCKKNLHCVLCRRMMLRISEKIAKKEAAEALLTGESLGQVASQTLKNIRVESQAVEIPIIRPLIGLDKLEIESIAKKIDTYELSILPGMCCSMVPKKPSTYSQLKRVLEEEKMVDIENLTEEALKGAWQP
jgi:thiamine biosynthesis protein ThiI